MIVSLVAEGGGIEPDAEVTAPPWVVTAFNDTSRGTPSKEKQSSPEQSGLLLVVVLAARFDTELSRLNRKNWNGANANRFLLAFSGEYG